MTASSSQGDAVYEATTRCHLLPPPSAPDGKDVVARRPANAGRRTPRSCRRRSSRLPRLRHSWVSFQTFSRTYRPPASLPRRREARPSSAACGVPRTVSQMVSRWPFGRPSLADCSGERARCADCCGRPRYSSLPAADPPGTNDQERLSELMLVVRIPVDLRDNRSSTWSVASTKGCSRWHGDGW
jgi:hypothetical protein